MESHGMSAGEGRAAEHEYGQQDRENSQREALEKLYQGIQQEIATFNEKHPDAASWDAEIAQEHADLEARMARIVNLLKKEGGESNERTVH